MDSNENHGTEKAAVKRRLKIINYDILYSNHGFGLFTELFDLLGTDDRKFFKRTYTEAAKEIIGRSE